MVSAYEEAVLQIKSQIDIVEIISEEVVLKKKGGNYWGLCPFHDDKKPYFCVSPSKGIYKCFSCGAGGDALSFIVKTENKDFKEIIQELAEKFGIEMPTTFKKTNPEIKNQKKK